MIRKTIQLLEEKAKNNPKRVVFPEGEDEKIIASAAYAKEKGFAHSILIGDKEVIESKAKDNNISLEGIAIRAIPGDEEKNQLSQFYSENGGTLSAKGIARKLKNPLYFATMLLKSNQADAMVAGLNYSTADVILAGESIIGLQEGISTPSSIFLMEVPGFEGPQGELIVFADCGVCVKPNINELADIAIVSAKTTKQILDWDPRIAMLSFSTKGSVECDETEKTVQATKLIHERYPELKVDGEFQLDAAIIPAIANKKVKEESTVSGNANILIFPDLNAGNICYKAVQRFAGANAYGPFLQGFDKTISDLSRGSSIEDIIGVTIMAVLCSAD